MSTNETCTGDRNTATRSNHRNRSARSFARTIRKSRYIIRLNSRVVIGCKVGCGRGRQKGHVARFVLASRYSGTRSSIVGRTKSTKEKGEFEASARQTDTGDQLQNRRWQRARKSHSPTVPRLLLRFTISTYRSRDSSKRDFPLRASKTRHYAVNDRPQKAPARKREVVDFLRLNAPMQRRNSGRCNDQDTINTKYEIRNIIRLNRKLNE